MNNIQIQPGLKAKLWLIILVNKTKLNLVMLNGEGNENGIKINRSNQQKNKLHVQHTFFSNQQKKKTNLHVQHAFCLFLRCFAQLQRCFVGLKRQTSQLHIIFMEELSYVLTQYFVSCVLRFYFSLPLIFTLLAASISHCLTAALNFHVFLPTKFVFFVFNHSLQLFLSNKVEKDTTLLLFFLSKSPSGHAISFQIKP